MIESLTSDQIYSSLTSQQGQLQAASYGEGYEAVMAFVENQAANGIRQMGSGHFRMIGGNIDWTHSNAGIVGAGIDRTIIESVPTEESRLVTFYNALTFDSTCENVLFQDLTFVGTVANRSIGHLRNIVFNRVKFTTSQDEALQRLGWVSTNGS